MSRIGKLPIHLPQGVSVDVDANNLVTVKGPKGTLTQQVSNDIKVNVDNGVVTLAIGENSNDGSNAKHGLYRALLHNMVVGVTEEFKKSLVVNGVGYKVAKQGNKIVMNLGLSHPVEVEEENGVRFEVKDNIVTCIGISKEAVGQLAAKVRATRPIEPYHGYGIRYESEKVSLKEGKASGKGKK